MSDIDIHNLKYDRKEVGKTFSSSKVLHKWEFVLNKKYHKIDFYDSRLSYKRKIVLDSSVLFYEKDGSDNFSYKFTLAGYNFEIRQLYEDKYDLLINNKRFKKLQDKERNGDFDNEKKEEEEIDEYNKRAMKYNGSNYYEGMEYKIMEKQNEKIREKEREREEKREEYENDEGEDEDDLFDNIDINQIKNNVDRTMNKMRGNNINNNNNYDPFFNSGNNKNNGNINNNINQGLNDFFNFDFTNNNNNNNN